MEKVNQIVINGKSSKSGMNVSVTMKGSEAFLMNSFFSLYKALCASDIEMAQLALGKVAEHFIDNNIPADFLEMFNERF